MLFVCVYFSRILLVFLIFLENLKKHSPLCSESIDMFLMCLLAFILECLLAFMRSLDVKLQNYSADYTYVNFSGASAYISASSIWGTSQFWGNYPFECGRKTLKLTLPTRSVTRRNCSNTNPILPCNYPITTTPLNPLQPLERDFKIMQMLAKHTRLHKM